MNRRRFGRISLLVTVALVVLLVVQAWSLASMYHDRREEFSRQVMQAMTRAAYDDLLLGNKPSGHKSHISFSSSGNIDSIRVDMIQEITVKNLDGAGKSITFTPKSDTIHHDISISDGPETRFIRQEIRIPSVYVLRLNMARYDSLLTCNLQTAGIDLPHKVDVVRGPTDSTSSARLFTTKPPEDPEVVLTALNDSLRLKDPLTFTTSLTTDEELYFRLRIENPDRQLVRDMAGVIGSSLLMLAAVAGALIYLLRTLFRQKTLEEMRLDLTHNITHELKTPIAVANAANDALLDFGAANDAARRERYLTVIREQLAALGGMVQRILTMSVEERGEFTLRREELELLPLLEEIAARFRMKGRGRATIEVEAEGADPPLGPTCCKRDRVARRGQRHRHRPYGPDPHFRKVLPRADRRPPRRQGIRAGTLLCAADCPQTRRRDHGGERPGARFNLHTDTSRRWTIGYACCLSRTSGRSPTSSPTRSARRSST